VGDSVAVSGGASMAGRLTLAIQADVAGARGG